MEYVTAKKTREQNPPLMAWCGILLLASYGIFDAIARGGEVFGFILLSLFFILGYVMPTNKALRHMEKQEKVEAEIEGGRRSFSYHASSGRFEEGFQELSEKIDRAREEYLRFAKLRKEWEKENSAKKNNPWEEEYQYSWRLVNSLEGLLVEYKGIYRHCACLPNDEDDS